MIAGGLYYIVNGPDGFNTPVQGFVVDANTLKIVSTFRPGTSELSNPHDVSVSPNGESVFVVQLDPHRAWKFVPKGLSNLKYVIIWSGLATLLLTMVLCSRWKNF